MITDYFTSDITIKRISRTSDGAGAFNETTTTIGIIKGRVSPISSNKIVEFNKETYTIDARLYCNVGENIIEGDSIEFAGEKFIAMSPLNIMNLNHHLEVDLIRKK